MDPSRCSVVVSFQPSPPPFIIEDQHIFNDNNNNDNNVEPSYTSLLQSIFGQGKKSNTKIYIYIYMCVYV